VHQDEEVTELVGMCLWDVFANNHKAITSDGRLVDGECFRGAGAFLNEHFSGDRDGWSDGDYLRFYRGTIWIAERAT
jgi:hypothetical protein